MFTRILEVDQDAFPIIGYGVKFVELVHDQEIALRIGVVFYDTWVLSHILAETEFSANAAEAPFSIIRE